jgi:hypothetical protein
MNVTDITQEIMKHTIDGAIWFMLEHRGEEDWMARWMFENSINPDVYIDHYEHPDPNMNCRGLHDLIIFKENKHARNN